MRILITGATGFVGRNLLPKLIQANHEIFEITIDPDISKELYGGETRQFYFFNDNLNDLKNELNNFKPEALIHLASYLTSSDDTEDMQKLISSNISFLCCVLDAVKETGLKWFINTGSSAEYYNGDEVLNPAYLYSATKTASRIFVDYYSKAYEFYYTTIVPYTIYGGVDTREKIIDLIYNSLESKEPVNLTLGNQVLDFIHIEDVVDFYITCLLNLNKIPNKTNFHLGTGVGHSIREISSIMEMVSNRSANIKWGARSYRPRDIMYAVADISIQDLLFNWKPKIQIEDGIKKFLKERKINIK
jgi:nucleoside-diphosphate-sugar epimerase